MFLTRPQRVFAILLNYQNPSDTLRCVSSLRRSTMRGIFPVVIDNASGNGDSEQLQDVLGPGIPVLESPENRGYAAGNNIGIRHALDRDADYVWILNPDTTVETDTLQGLLTTMALHPDAGFVGPVNLIGDSDPASIQSAGGRIDWESGAVAESFDRGRAYAARPRRDPYEVDYVQGSSMLVRRAVFEDIGLLPEHYFLYFEETDLQVTASRRGWKSIINPLARAWHFQGSATHLPAPYYTYYYIRGRILFARKFTDSSDETIRRGLNGFINGWRSRVRERAPDWLDAHNTLVEWALADGYAGVTGARDDVNAMRRPGIQ
ncbi:MAG: glycosyltransferase family 2 protein [Acidimicrobiia bacterium]|nr:glycosyltransferase family 2 protein [Acidimicrobiia bacterium]